MADLALNPLTQVSPPLIEGAPTRAEVTEAVAGVAENKAPRNWYIAISISGAMTFMLVAMLSYEVFTGVGVWGNNSPVFWGWPITNFVFWVGIGHASTLISAILFLFRQRWRTSINRFAEAMTLFAVCYAGIFPVFHVGRVWRAYWLLPLPTAWTCGRTSENVYVAATVLGSVCTMRRAGIVGQKLEELAAEVDYICPMLYPSSFKGLATDPLENAYPLVRENLEAAAARLGGERKKLRPWLQNFPDPRNPEAPLSVATLRLQLKAAADAGASGWMFWDPAARYTDRLREATRNP